MASGRLLGFPLTQCLSAESCSSCWAAANTLATVATAAQEGLIYHSALEPFTSIDRWCPLPLLAAAASSLAAEHRSKAELPLLGS